jgi:hypothetical protein
MFKNSSQTQTNNSQKIDFYIGVSDITKSVKVFFVVDDKIEDLKVYKVNVRLRGTVTFFEGITDQNRSEDVHSKIWNLLNLNSFQRIADTHDWFVFKNVNRTVVEAGIAKWALEKKAQLINLTPSTANASTSSSRSGATDTSASSSSSRSSSSSSSSATDTSTSSSSSSSSSSSATDTNASSSSANSSLSALLIANSTVFSTDKNKNTRDLIKNLTVDVEQQGLTKSF